MVPSMRRLWATARVYNVNDLEDFIDFVAPPPPSALSYPRAGNQIKRNAGDLTALAIRRYLWQLVWTL